MEVAATFRDESSGNGRCAERQPSCPCCGGHLFPSRGAFQCPRCHFRICEGCQGAESPPESES